LKALFLHPINAEPSLYVQAIYQVIILLVLNYSGTKILKLSGTSDQQMLVKNTIIFNAFVFCQLFNEINARRPEKRNVFEGIHKNYLFISIIVITVALQFVIVEFLNKFAQTTKLPVKWWILCILIGIVSYALANPFINFSFV
jgi:Ca2+-transporting ATPase